MSSTIDRVELRRAIKSTVEQMDSPDRDVVANEIAADRGVPAAAVSDEIDDMERHGFVYLVNGEVRLP